MPETTRKRGCDSCRERHLKCDRKATCANCAKKGYTCSRSSKIRFRHAQDDTLEAGELSFSKTQKWCSTSQRKIRFIDETYDISSLYDERSSPEDAAGPRNAAESTKPADVPPTLVSPTNTFQAVGNDSRDLPVLPVNEASLDASVLPGPLPSFDYGTPGSLSQRTLPALQEMIEFGYYSPPDLRIPQSSFMQPFPFGEGQSKEAKVNPLLLGGPPAFQWCEKQDVVLMRHFVDVIAPMFDHGGWKKTFASRIPHMATAHRALFKAISAVSAVSLGIMGLPQAVDPRQLRWDTFNSLDVMDPGAVEVVDDPQFLAINLLKMFDSFDRSIDPGWSLDDGLGVLQGPQTLNLGQITLVDQLRQDTSWMSLRMQLYFAVINQEPCSVSLSLDSESGLGEDNDYQWARKMILHLHNVVNYCFEDDKDGSTYNELVAYAQEWVKLKPVSFDPIFVGDAQGEDGFPDIFVLNDAVAQGWQMYHLSRILLVAHDHNRPMLGPSGALVRRSIDKSLRKDAQIVCSIANCIDDGINPAHLAACMAISLTGHLFTRESEQKSLLNILVQTEKQFGWPTSTIQNHVRETWEP